MSSKYYQDELNNLRVLSKAFAEKNPAIASHLSAESTDPDVNMLLQGVAFLTSMIREKLNDEFAYFTQSIVQQLHPSFLKPIPSTVILAFAPKTILKTTKTIDKGVYVDSQPSEGVKCRFSTTSSFDLSPLDVVDASCTKSDDVHTHVKLNFKLTFGTNKELSIDELELYVGGEYSISSDIFYALITGTKSIKVSDGTRSKRLDVSQFKQGTQGSNKSLFEREDVKFASFKHIQEYFVNKHKFLFFKVSGLSEFLQQSPLSAFSIEFGLEDDLPALKHIGPETFKLHCVPAVNQFDHDAEPVVYEHKTSEIRIKPARSKGNDIFVQNIVKISGGSKKSLKKTVYKQLNSALSSSVKSPVYSVSYKSDDLSEIPGPSISLYYPSSHKKLDRENLSIKLECTNGNIPANLRVGDINVSTSSSPELATFENVTAPTNIVYQNVGGDILWKFISSVSLNLSDIKNVETLKNLLRLFLYEHGQNGVELNANQKRIESILSVDVVPVTKIIRGAIYRGQEVRVVCNKDNFSSTGDMYIFGVIINELMSSTTSVNFFNKTVLVDSESAERLEWPEVFGNHQKV